MYFSEEVTSLRLTLAMFQLECTVKVLIHSIKYFESQMSGIWSREAGYMDLTSSHMLEFSLEMTCTSEICIGVRSSLCESSSEVVGIDQEAKVEIKYYKRC